MSSKRKQFIVLVMSDKDLWGYNEETLPPLLKLIDLSEPDSRSFSYTTVVGYYLRSRFSIKRISLVIKAIENLCASDSRYETLGIGLACGEMIAEFDWLGRIKNNFQPLGGVSAQALVAIRDPQIYKKVLDELSQSG
jgi:hypothetical protein